MSPRMMILATSLVSALFVLGAATPLAYYGFQLLNQKIDAGQENLQAVVIELKSEALAEIKTVAEKTATETMAGGAQIPSDVAAQLTALNSSMTVLQTSVVDLQAEQKKLADLMNLRTEGLMAAAATAQKPQPPMMRPGAREDSLNQTLYFSLGTFKGAKTDRSVAALIPKIVEYSASNTCASNVMGFSDTLGGDKSNLELSLKRAEHVAELLRKSQIPVGTVQGWGERWLLVHTVDGIKNDENRRVVIETVCGATVPKATTSVS